MFTAISLALTDDLIKIIWYIYIVENCSAIYKKKKESITCNNTVGPRRQYV